VTDGTGRRTDPTVESLSATVFRVPTDQPEADGTAEWDATVVVVVVARCGELAGTGWTYGPAACASVVRDLLAPVVVGTSALAVPASWGRMVRAVRNATRAGIAGYAISAVDVALWDLKARLLDLPLADLFGVVSRDVPVYGSGGFTSYDDDRLVEQLTGWVGQGIPRVKIKIGQDWGTAETRDLERISLARRVIGPGTELYVDANGAYTAKQAIRIFSRAVDCDVAWFEEPVSSDDLSGLRAVRRAVSAEVAAGEYGTDIAYFRRMVDAESVDCLQIDATRCGGYTEWFRAAAVAASAGLDVSAHCAPNLHAPAAAATPNLRHVEWFHDHVRIEADLFAGSLDPAGGSITPGRDRPGHGMSLDQAHAAGFRVPE
jgi:L-alanine-DL-glutamate epimerase-like enolase superfamily enzyme